MSLAAFSDGRASAQDFEWTGVCDVDWHTICDVGPCPNDPDKRHYMNNWGKEGCSLELEFPGPNSLVVLHISAPLVVEWGRIDGSTDGPDGWELSQG
ncbi:MAG: hypothetical protein C4547_07420, partial [Phycisphaerales bacterium]